MKVLRINHHYELDNVEGGTQDIQFIEKGPKPDGAPGELITINNGTTNEEVLRALIDRLKGLNTKFPCRENSAAIISLQTALRCLGERTANRKARNVEGWNVA